MKRYGQLRKISRAAVFLFLAGPMVLAGTALAQSPDGANAGPSGAFKAVRLASAKPYQTVGIASYYGARFHGRTTASGEIFDMHAMTAAHKTLPFGTMLRVVHLASQREVVVRINDRGPFYGGRILDLSYAAARKLGVIKAGKAQVRIEVIPSSG
jgi:rare lipoprotein A